MAQSGFTPILIYGSTTASAAPSAGNLTTTTNGVELAINATDGKLFYKDNAGVVQVLATKDAAAGTFTTLNVSGDANFTSTGAIQIASGTTAQRPGTPTTADFRFNTTLGKAEIYNGSVWTGVGGGATGGGSDTIFFENGQTVTTNYTITASNNAGTFGPVAINAGVVVTVPSGSVWTIV